MQSKEIYYFTGSGNSLAVAKTLAKKLKAKLIPIAALIKQSHYEIKAECIGFVFPLYHFKPPRIVENFIKKSKGLQSKYIFSVCTYGIAASNSLPYFAKLIKSNSGKLAGGFAVKMPFNAIGSKRIKTNESELILSNWTQKVDKIYRYIDAELEGIIENDSFFLSLFSKRIIQMFPSILKFILQLMVKGSEAFRFSVNESCNGCGFCAKICPVTNIGIENNKPVWSKNCEGCFACLHWCPQRAVIIGKNNLDIKIYQHPDIGAADMIKQIHYIK